MCVTGLGEIEGLATSFLVAGTRHVVSTLWNVRDEFAPKLMDLFYSGPFIDKPGAALSESQRHWASQYGPFAHPKFWAPFYVVERFDAGIPETQSGLYII
jgi:CHAT domain-containing protein